MPAPAPASSVPFVGLTGGIGSGKSTALAALERLGAATLSTDAVVHELYESDELRDAVVARWGQEIAPDGAVDRAGVAARAFASDADRRWLEERLWPRVGARVEEFRQQALTRKPPPVAAVVEVPLLFEAGIEAGFDATIAVVAPEELRARRAGDRGHAALDKRSSRQLTQEDKARRADHTVVNDGAEAQLEARLAAALKAISEVGVTNG